MLGLYSGNGQKTGGLAVGDSMGTWLAIGKMFHVEHFSLCVRALTK
jgi:hypothetical protein